MDDEKDGNKRLTIEEIERLSREEFDALSESERRRYFEFMDRENFPTPWEFYGYDAERWTPEDDDVAEVEPAEDGPDSTAGGGSCDGQAMPEPTPERRPNGQEPAGPTRPDSDGLFGEVIFAYTREQALADGVLIDVTETARFADFRFPVALTRTAWGRYVGVPEGVEAQDEDGRLWDILWMCRVALGRKQDASELLFKLHIRNDDREGEPPLVTLKAVCGPDDHGKPCITIMLPDED